MTTAPLLAPGRDSQMHEGYGKSATQFCFIPGEGVDSVSTSGALTAGTDYYTFFYVDGPVLVDQLLCEVTTNAGTNFRIGTYAADGFWQPTGAPLADSGNLSSATTGVKTYTPATPMFLPAGRYLSVLNCDNAPAFRIVRGIRSLIFSQTLGATPSNVVIRVSRAYAAFPTPGTAWTTTSASSTGQFHMVFYRVTAA